MEEYYQTLQGAAAMRYVAKIQLVSGVDPYKLKLNDMDTNPKSLPSVDYPDIVNYCVYTKSAYTMDELKSYKSLDAYHQFVSGWVSDLGSYVVNNRVIVKSKVRHSQSISKAPLQPWIIAEKSGNILAAHCNCMAGLAETCTHVSATLFAIDASVRLEKSRTVTEEAAYWMLPSNVKEVKYSRLKDINFTSATNMKRILDSKLSQTPVRQYQLLPLPFVEPPNATEMNNFFQILHDTGVKPSILSIIPVFVESYVPRFSSSLYPWVCVDLEKYGSRAQPSILEKVSTTTSVGEAAISTAMVTEDIDFNIG
nr:uncharacterized protein LOC124815766 [Hydra vulgaris]